MKISHAKFLVTFLFYIDTTLPETIKIIRTLDRPNGKRKWWKNGVDSFDIPQSVCYGENSEYGNYCNTSCSIDEKGNHGRYLCSCSQKNSTLTYFENRWRCLENKEVRKELGCEVNATLFAGEMTKHNLRTLSPVANIPRKTKLRNPEGFCTINISSSWFIGCHGKKVLGLHSNRTKEMFLLQRTPENKSTNRPYFIKVDNTVDHIFRGRVINLGITCNPPIPIAEGCLIFKLEGSFTCPVDRSTKPIFLSTIYPTTSSVAVTILSTTYLEKAGVSVTIDPIQTYLEKATPSATLEPTLATRPVSGGKQKNDDVSSSSQPGIIAGVTVFGALVLLLVAILFICRCRRSRKNTHTSTSDQTNQESCTVSRNAKTNSELELEENDGYETCEVPLTSIYASRYKVPQQQVLQRPLCNQNTISSEGNSHSDGAYAVVDIPEGHHICGHGNVQEPVYNVLQDPKIMFQNYGSGTDEPLYYTLEGLSVKDSGESVNNGPSDPEPVHNVFEDPEVMFQTYGSGIDQPMYYALEDLSVKDSEESVNNGPTEPEPVYNVLDEPYTEGAEEPGCLGNVTIEGPVQNSLEEPDHYAGYPCKDAKNHNVLEAPGLSGTKTSDVYDPVSSQDPEYDVLV